MKNAVCAFHQNLFSQGICIRAFTKLNRPRERSEKGTRGLDCWQVIFILPSLIQPPDRIQQVQVRAGHGVRIASTLFLNDCSVTTEAID
jgi:hypothetical protein